MIDMIQVASRWVNALSSAGWAAMTPPPSRSRIALRGDGTAVQRSVKASIEGLSNGPSMSERM
jgi:hypothetical protein